MQSLPLANPFPGAASFLVRETDSTMDEARRLARLGFPAGSLVAADSQRAGRGRLPGRRWEDESGKSLLFTLRLGAEAAATPALPLRAGAALCRAVLTLALRSGRTYPEAPRLKWPNDLVLGGRKAAGILCEARAGGGEEGVYIGVGVNCNQGAFPAALAGKATSLALELGAELDRWALLELFLSAFRHLLAEVEWRADVEDLLWRRGEEVDFLAGLPGASAPLRGVLAGIDDAGSLLLQLPGSPGPRAFAAGELLPGPELTAQSPSVYGGKHESR